MNQEAEKSVAKTLHPAGVARRVGVNRSTLHRWRKRGLFPPPTIKVGRTVRWSTAVVDAFIEQGVRE